MTPEITFDPVKHRYFLDGTEIPSVTKILGVLQKGGLPWWGMQTGVQGVVRLRNLGVEMPWDDPDGIVKLLTEHKITVNHVRDDAGTRGKSIHDALELWAASGTIANPADFPAEDRGYVQALARALLHLQPEPVATEVMVASTEHRFAGRFDLLARIDGKLCLLDLKSSKRIYPESHYLQLEAYAGALAETEGPPVEEKLVMRVGADGNFEIGKSCATFEDFLGVKAAYDAQERVKVAVRVAKKAAKLTEKAAA